MEMNAFCVEKFSPIAGNTVSAARNLRVFTIAVK
jgi:hypothetical protein